MFDPVPKIPRKLKNVLDRYADGPKPDPSFVNRLHADLLNSYDAPARRPLRFSRGAVLAAVILALLAVTGAAYAVARMTGFIPGFGMVPSEASILALSAPAAQTQDGITLTVTQGVATSERLSLTLTQQGVPLSALPGQGDDNRLACRESPELILPDGSRLTAQSSAAAGYDAQNRYQQVYFFQPLPQGTTTATLRLACVPETMPGSAPTGWQIPLSFSPAPSSLAVLPVIAVTPSAQAVKYPLELVSVIETRDGYIFSGVMNPPLPGTYIFDIRGDHVSITAADGTPLIPTQPAGMPAQGSGNGESPWAYEVHTKAIRWPVRITISQVLAGCFDPARFSFDAGLAPRNGQIWQINQAVRSGGCTMNLQAVRRSGDAYIFRASSRSEGQLLNGFTPVIDGQPGSPTRQVQTANYLDVTLSFPPGSLPAGKISVYLSSMDVFILGPWSVQWQP